MKTNLQAKISMGFVLAMVFPVIASIITYNALSASIATSRWVEHTHEVIAKANLLIKLAVDAETGLRGFVITGDELFLEPYETGTIEFSKALIKLKETVSDNPQQVQLLERIQSLQHQWIAVAARPEIEARRKNLTEEAFRLVKDFTGKTILDELRQQVNKFAGVEKELLAKRNALDQQASERGKTVALAGSAIAVAMGLVLGLLLARMVTRGVGAVAAAAQLMAGGDLACRVQVAGQDELGALADSFNTMADALQKTMADLEETNRKLQAAVTEYMAFAEKIGSGDLTARVPIQTGDTIGRLGEALNVMAENLRELTGRARDTTSGLNSSTSQIMSVVNELVSTTNEQAASVNETTSTADEVRQTANQAAERARQVSEMVQESTQIAKEGLEAIQNNTRGMNDIKDQMATIAGNILALSEQTQQIEDIIITVNDIADQSNLLALNAAIEAARAGESGKGFAVVAGEVRNLADQSRQATAQVKEILSEIQKAANNAVMVTEEGTKRVDVGMNLIRKTGETIEAISNRTDKAAEAAQQIAASSRQQLVGVDQVLMAMENINTATLQSEAGAHQVRKAIENLNVIASRLSEIVEQYKT